MIRVCLSITLSVSMYSCQLALSVSLKFPAYLSQVYFYFCQLPQPAICHHLLQRLCFVCCVCQHCLCLLSVTKNVLVTTVICHRMPSVTISYLLQSTICHSLLSVTVSYLSQSAICHSLLSVTICNLSQSAICHSQLSVAMITTHYKVFSKSYIFYFRYRYRRAM